jgi:hypothetical protein
MYGGEPSKKKKRKHVMLDGGKRKGKQEKKRKTASCWRDGNQMDDQIDCCSAFFVCFRVGVFSSSVRRIGTKQISRCGHEGLSRQARRQ